MSENFLKSALAQGEFICSAELVLGRDHEVAEAETFVKDASGAPNGIKVVSLTDLPGGNPALPPEAFISYILENGLTPIAHLRARTETVPSWKAVCTPWRGWAPRISWP